MWVPRRNICDSSAILFGIKSDGYVCINKYLASGRKLSEMAMANADACVQQWTGLRADDDNSY
jgi:hypothetical protein